MSRKFERFFQRRGRREPQSSQRGLEMKTQFLIGKRIYFRPLEREDAPTLELYFNDPDVTRTLRFRGAMNLQDEEEFVDRIRKSTTDVCLGIVLKEKDRLIGTVGLHGIEQRCRHAEF